MVYFTSDLHLNHQAAIHMCNRPFETLGEMNDVLIQNINERVHKDDTLYILGDVSNRGTVEAANNLISKIKCKNIILVEGNHDRKYADGLFREKHKLTEIHLSYEGKNYSVTLCHFPMESWYKSRHGSLHFHGHIHSPGDAYNQQMKTDGIRRYDVGVDANDYRPVSFQEIISFMEV